MGVFLARTNDVMARVGTGVFVVGLIWALTAAPRTEGLHPAVWVMVGGLVLGSVGTITSYWAPVSRAPALAVQPPVRGSWRAVNSPATKVPSHGVHSAGQAHAIDLLIPVSRDEARRLKSLDHGFGHPTAFPAFGQPVYAAAPGVVVTAKQAMRDHRARCTPVARFCMALEGIVRSWGGMWALLGNHVIIRNDDGTHLLYAHLKQSSLQVRVGERVQTGEELAQVGNSGNSSEPHLHFQRQDIRRTVFAQGLPWSLVDQAVPPTGEDLMGEDLKS